MLCNGVIRRAGLLKKKRSIEKSVHIKKLVSQTNVESLLQLGRNGMLTARAVVPGTGPVSWEMTGKICYENCQRSWPIPQTAFKRTHSI